ncbi:hypothetical protein [Pluralibacter gergoviae]|uniref:hypothetical protein n=1 Tax=Pluralibacter gergoviae TaxID=61647 RepID=UPI000B1D3879|nr:hypothetical protein [Pluralibacter gergoviae]
MTVFAIVTTSASDNAAERMGVAIARRFSPQDFLRIGSTWLVDTKLPTSKDVTHYLCGGESVNEFQIHSFIVLPVNSYFGMHHPNTWEWLQSKGL